MAGKPSAFYKQRDFGFNLLERRHVTIGTLDLIFSHTTRTNTQLEHTSPFSLYKNDTDNRVKAVAYVKADLLIAHDLEKMHEILTLNFFRFVDALYMPWDPDAPCVNKEEIYSALNALSKEELVATLQAIGKQMTDTMEFNFYGAYQIDFSALLEISANNYTLILPTFIEALNNGQMEQLEEAKERLPEIFESERFVAYLCANINNAEVIEALNPSGSSAPHP